MAWDTAGVIVIAVVLVLIALSACCKSMRRAQLAQQEMRRMAERNWTARRGNQSGNHTVVPEQGHQNYAYEVYEIPRPQHAGQRHHNTGLARASHLPRRHRNTRPQDIQTVSSIVSDSPPPFLTAVDLPSPTKPSIAEQVINVEEPPPSYEDYLRLSSDPDPTMTSLEESTKY